MNKYFREAIYAEPKRYHRPNALSSADPKEAT
jgi:hypothetical protein